MSHILGEFIERYFGGALCYGPDIEDGFYYDTASLQFTSHKKLNLHFPVLKT